MAEESVLRAVSRGCPVREAGAVSWPCVTASAPPALGAAALRSCREAPVRRPREGCQEGPGVPFAPGQAEQTRAVIALGGAGAQTPEPCAESSRRNMGLSPSAR